jgi:hypothetical protein
MARLSIDELNALKAALTSLTIRRRVCRDKLLQFIAYSISQTVPKDTCREHKHPAGLPCHRPGLAASIEPHSPIHLDGNRASRDGKYRRLGGIGIDV